MPPMEGKKSAWGAKPPPSMATSSNAIPPKKDGPPPRPGAGTGPGQMHQPPASVSGPDGGKGRGPVAGYPRKPDGVPIRRKDVSPGKAGFVEELYTTRLDPEKLSEQQRKEAARIAAEIEEERNRKAGGRSTGFPSQRGAPPRKYWGEYEDDDNFDPANEGPPPPVHSATAFPALDSRPREPAPMPSSQELPQTSAMNNAGGMPNPAVPTSAPLAQKQFPPGSQQPIPQQDPAAVSYQMAGGPADAAGAGARNNASTNNANANNAGNASASTAGNNGNANSNAHDGGAAQGAGDGGMDGKLPGPGMLAGGPPPNSMLGMPPFMPPVPGRPPHPSSGASALSQFGLPMFGEGGGQGEGAGGQGEGGQPGQEMGGGGSGPGGMMPPPMDPSRGGPFPPLGGEALSMYLEHPENAALAGFIAKDYQFKMAMRQEAALLQERLKDADRARESAERQVQQLERDKSQLRQEKLTLEKQLDAQAANASAAGGGAPQHLLETAERLREELARAHESLRSSEERERQVYLMLEREKMQAQSMMHHRQNNFFQMLHQQESRIQQQEARIQDLQRHNLHLSSQMQGRGGGEEGDGANKAQSAEGGSSGGGGGSGGGMDAGPPGMGMGPGGMGGFNLHQMSMQMQMQQMHHQNQMPAMPQLAGQMPPPNSMLPPPQQQAQMAPPPQQPQQASQPPPPPQLQQQPAPGEGGGPGGAWPSGGPPQQGGHGEGGDGRPQWPMVGGAGGGGPEEAQKQGQGPRPQGGGVAVAPQGVGSGGKGPGGSGGKGDEALVVRKRELLALKKSCGHHEFFDLDNMSAPQVEAAIKRIQEQYNQGAGRQGGRQVRGGEQGARATQNVPGEEWEVVQPTKKGGGRGMVDEKRVGTFTLQDKSGIISGNLLQGLLLYHNVLQPPEEQALLDFIAEELARARRRELAGSTFVPAHRQSRRACQLQYGVAYNYAEQTVGGSQVEAMPAILAQLADKLVSEGIIQPAQRPNTAVVSVYEEGECLPPHVDAKDFARPICTLSLLSAADMCFGDRAGRIDVHAGGMEGFPITLPRRSVVVVQDGVCSNDVQHAIGPVKARWMSVTLRRQ